MIFSYTKLFSLYFLSHWNFRFTEIPGAGLHDVSVLPWSFGGRLLVPALSSPSGILSYIVGIEWAVLVVFAIRLHRRSNDLFPLFAGLVFLVLAGSQLFSDSHPVFSVGVVAPGTWSTRLLNLEVEPWLRRALEPSLVILFFVLSQYIKAESKILFLPSLVALCVVWGAEAITLFPGMRERFFDAKLVAAHAILSQFFILTLLCGFFLAGGNTVRIRYLTPATIYLIVVVGGCFVARGLIQQQPAHCGVHFYSWFPENWAAGFSGEHFVPPVMPEAGEYNSAQKDVFEQQLKWISAAQVDTVIFDWWPKNPAVRRRVDKEVDQLRGKEKKFLIHYESLALKDKAESTVPDEGQNDVYLSPARTKQLGDDWLRIAEHYMKDENYLRLNGRPVLFVYASRHLVGPVREAIDSAREVVFTRTGLELYVVGDEVFFNVVDHSRRRGVYLRPELSPNWSRLSAFDAISCYNPYESSRTEHAGSEGAERFFSDVEKLYRSYYSVASTLGIDFIPGVLPGYNDRALRPKEDHFILPRVIAASGKDFFETGLERLIKPFVDSGNVPMFTVTSWNEWNEGSQIEPAAESAATTEDDTGSKAFTQGEEYLGYGELYLDILNRFNTKMIANWATSSTHSE